MMSQSLINAAFVLIAAYMLFAYTNRDGIDLPRPREGYHFVPNETQKLLAEAGKEAARVLAAREAHQRGELGAAAATDAASATALTQYGVALREGDEALEATIHYVHHYGQLFAQAEAQHHRGTEQGHHSDAAATQSPVRVHVFLAADNGTYSGMHELHFIRAAMRYSTPIEIDGCRSASFGFLEKPHRDALTWRVQNQQRSSNAAGGRSNAPGLRKIPVLAVTTGTYVTSSSTCTAAVMSLPMFSVQSVTLIGTAGVSPVVGGGGWDAQLPPLRRAVSAERAERDANPVCQQPWSAESEKVALGSVCVTYSALLQECGHCIEENELSSLCSRPRCSIHNSTTFFGPCAFRHPTSAFAEQMKGAMYRKPFPAVPMIVQEAMQAFWEVNEAAPEYVAAPPRKAQLKSRRMRGAAAAAAGTANASETILSYNRVPPTAPILLNCAEVATNQNLVGPRSDILCRQYTDELFKGLYPAKELSCVQAMEGMGVLHVLTRDYPHIPVAIVRGASNYNMFPLSKHVHLLSRTRNANGVKRDEWYVSWDQKEHYVSDERFHAFTRASYRYAIEAASAVVLNYFLSAETVLPGMV